MVDNEFALPEIFNQRHQFPDGGHADMLMPDGKPTQMSLAELSEAGDISLAVPTDELATELARQEILRRVAGDEPDDLLRTVLSAVDATGAPVNTGAATYADGAAWDADPETTAGAARTAVQMARAELAAADKAPKETVVERIVKRDAKGLIESVTEKRVEQ